MSQVCVNHRAWLQSEDSLWGASVSAGAREPPGTLVAVRRQLWGDSLLSPLRESQGRNLVCQACAASTFTWSYCACCSSSARKDSSWFQPVPDPEDRFFFFIFFN